MRFRPQPILRLLMKIPEFQDRNHRRPFEPITRRFSVILVRDKTSDLSVTQVGNTMGARATGMVVTGDPIVLSAARQSRLSINRAIDRVRAVDALSAKWYASAVHGGAPCYDSCRPNKSLLF